MTQRENSRTPNLAELIRMAVRQNQAELHVSLPGKIAKYDEVEQKADIDVMLQRVLVASDGTELPEETIPQLMDVPIIFPRGGAGTGNFFISWPLAAGDLVHLVFIERSIDQYLDKQGELTKPLDFRMHNLSDAVAYPGFYPRRLSLKEASAENLVLGRDEGMQLHITPADIAEFRVGGVADVSAAIAETLKSFLDTTIKNWLVAHTHSSGVGPTGPPLEAGTYPTYDDAITADNLKLKDN